MTEIEDIDCYMCGGTGISSSGKVDQDCSSCNGTGVYCGEDDDFYIPDEYEDDDY